MRGYPRQLTAAERAQMTRFQRLAEGRRRQLQIRWIDLEVQTGIKRPTLRNLLRQPGRGAPRHEQLIVLAKALDLPLLELQIAVAKDYGWAAVEVEDGPLKLLITHVRGLEENRRQVEQLLTDVARGILLGQEPRRLPSQLPGA